MGIRAIKTWLASRRVAKLKADQRHMLRVLLKYSTDHIYFKDRNGRFLCMSDSHAKRFGLINPEDAVGKTDFDFFSDEHARQAFESEQEIIRTGRPKIAVEEKEVWPDGSCTWVSTTRMPFYDQEGRLAGIFGISRDITKTKKLEEELRHRTKVDGLTGLWNRKTFVDEGEREVERARRYGTPVSLMMMDIDHFKRVNDTYGHAAGDAALRQVAGAIKDHLRSVDMPGRLGGEEFGVLLPGTSLNGAQSHAERLRLAIAERTFYARGEELHISVSIGVVAYRKGVKNFDDLLRRSDDAMYRAKSNGRNCVFSDAGIVWESR